MPRNAPSVLTLSVLPATALRVEHGANFGDTLSVADDLLLDDVYALAFDAAPAPLMLVPQDHGHFKISQDSPQGAAGAMLALDACVTLMSQDGKTTELLILVELDADHIAQIYALPLVPLCAKTEYQLVGIDTENARAKLAQVACVSFTRGTHITLSTGEQRRIEDLQIGDRVLTRDDGPQEIRWIGQSTTRATGDFAPIRIAAGVLHNTHDLLVSPEHRLFLYQRSDQLNLGRSELLIRARHLENGTTIARHEGGFVDYFQVLFDSHQIIYAEGIAAETLLLDDHTRPALPGDLAQRLSAGGLDHDPRQHSAIEVEETQIDRSNVLSLLRRATTG